MLRRDLYRGVIVWGKKARVDKGGRVGVKVSRPESEWQRTEAPALAIISPELWAAVQARLTETASAYIRTTGGKLGGRPQSGIESQHLLTGLTQCSMCGGSMVFTKRTAGRATYSYYRCSVNWRRGALGCANGLAVPEVVADRAVIDALRKEVLDAEVITATLRKAAERIAANPAELEAKRTTAEAELRKVEQGCRTRQYPGRRQGPGAPQG
jgi:site-specific DNA recombinase